MDLANEASSQLETTTEVTEQNEVQTPEAPAKSSQEEATGLSKLQVKAAEVLQGKKDLGIADTAPKYTPNYKFKVLDKEQEFDEWLRPVVKDADTEKRVRELLEKAHGLEHVKAERQKFREQATNIEGQYTALSKGLDYLSGMVEKGDLHGFFKELSIPEDKILQYALSRVKYREMPPEQRQQIDAQNESQQRLEYFERANSELLNAFNEQRTQQRASELDGYLGRPEVSQAISQFDQRIGQPGAFRDEVIRRGQYYASLPNPQDISVEQAVREVMMLAGVQAAQDAQASQGQAPQAAMQAAPQAVQQTQKPVIPNIKGRGTSPVKKAVRSIDDLRALARTAE